MRNAAQNRYQETLKTGITFGNPAIVAQWRWIRGFASLFFNSFAFFEITLFPELLSNTCAIDFGKAPNYL